MPGTAEQSHWIATAILESHRPFTNDLRLEEVTTIVDRTLAQCPGSGIFLFPGGLFSADRQEPRAIYRWIEGRISDLIKRSGRMIAICLGVDGRLQGMADGRTAVVDQVACAFTVNGCQARGRKFAPTKDEKNTVQVAGSYLSKEDGLSRVFSFLGARYYLAVCYDSRGISNSSCSNPGCEAILNFVHEFRPRGQGPSGDVQFARKVFSGASKQWGVPVFASVVFFDRAVPESWPSGVLWNKSPDMSVSRWLYQDNPLRPIKRFAVSIPEGYASIRLFR